MYKSSLGGGGGNLDVHLSKDVLYFSINGGILNKTHIRHVLTDENRLYIVYIIENINWMNGNAFHKDQCCIYFFGSEGQEIFYAPRICLSVGFVHVR